MLHETAVTFRYRPGHHEASFAGPLAALERLIDSVQFAGILRHMIEKEGIIRDGSREALAARLQEHGILPTAQRVDIASILLAVFQHLSADQVLERLNRAGGNVSKATVYNTLGLLAEKGLVRQVIVDSTRVFYDSNVMPHHHFYNVDDGSLIDVDAAEIPIEQLPKPPPGSELVGVDVVIRIRGPRSSARIPGCEDARIPKYHIPR